MKNLKTKSYLLIWLGSLLICLIYLSLAFNNSIWTDEAYSLWLIKGSFKEIVIGTSHDVHPPLYYLIAKVFSIIFPLDGTNLLFQKLAPILSFFLTYGLVGSWMWKKGFGWKAIFVFDLLLFSIPCMMEYALQLRMYSWGMFFVTMSGILAYDCFDEDKIKSWGLLSLTAAGAAYTHNFALVSAFFVYVLLGAALLFTNKKRLVKWLVSGIGVFVLYLPWLSVLLRQFGCIAGNDNYWIQPITKKTLVSYLEWTFGNDFKFVFIGITLIFVFVGIYSLIKIKQNHAKEDYFSQLCWMVPFLTMALGVTVSKLTTPVYYNRYVVCALGILFVGVGVTLRDIDLKRPAVIAVIVLFLLMGAEQYRENYIQEYVSNGAKNFTEFVTENLNGQTVFYNNETLKIIYEYYVGDRLCYYEDADFTQNEDEWYYIFDTSMPSFAEEKLETEGIKCEYVSDEYIEEASFKIMRLYKE